MPVNKLPRVFLELPRPYFDFLASLIFLPHSIASLLPFTSLEFLFWLTFSLSLMPLPINFLDAFLAASRDLFGGWGKLEPKFCSCVS